MGCVLTLLGLQQRQGRSQAGGGGGDGQPRGLCRCGAHLSASRRSVLVRRRTEGSAAAALGPTSDVPNSASQSSACSFDIMVMPLASCSLRGDLRVAGFCAGRPRDLTGSGGQHGEQKAQVARESRSRSASRTCVTKSPEHDASAGAVASLCPEHAAFHLHWCHFYCILRHGLVPLLIAKRTCCPYARTPEPGAATTPYTAGCTLKRRMNGRAVLGHCPRKRQE